MQLILSRVINFVKLEALILVLVLSYCKKIQKLHQAVAMSSDNSSSMVIILFEAQKNIKRMQHSS